MSRKKALDTLSSRSGSDNVAFSSEESGGLRQYTDPDYMEEDIKDMRQDRTERKRYANKIYWMLLSFLSVVIVIVICCAADRIFFSLSDSVLIALLTTTSANMIGIFMVVARYLFNPRAGRDKQV